MLMHEKDVIVSHFSTADGCPPLLAHVHVPAVMTFANDLCVTVPRGQVEFDLIANPTLHLRGVEIWSEESSKQSCLVVVQTVTSCVVVGVFGR